MKNGLKQYKISHQISMMERPVLGLVLNRGTQMSREHICCEHEYESGCACCTYECKEANQK